MTIQIETESGFFDGTSLNDILKDIVEVAEEKNDFWVNIKSIEKIFENGFSSAFFQSEIEKVQKDLDIKLSEAEQEYYNQLEEEDWREQENKAYWANR